MPEVPDKRRTERVRGSDEVAKLRELLEKADGTLIPLKKKTADGNKLYLTARHLKAPVEGEKSAANPKFYAWADELNRATAVLIIDVYAEAAPNNLVPVGHMDWWIEHNSANGGGNMQDAAIPQNAHEQRASQWKDWIAFRTIPELQQQNIGTLMLASSAVALQAKGVKTFYPGALLDPAEKTYARFGVSRTDFDTNERELPIRRLNKRNVVNKIFKEFVG